MFYKMIIQINLISFISLINIPMSVIKKLKNSLILYMCVSFPFLSFLLKERGRFISMLRRKIHSVFLSVWRAVKSGCLTSGMAKGLDFIF